MPKPDFEKMAKEIIDGVFNAKSIKEYCQPQNTFSKFLANKIEHAYLLGVEAGKKEERERCAKIAEERFDGSSSTFGHTHRSSGLWN